LHGRDQAVTHLAAQDVAVGRMLVNHAWAG
jgi:hypothetical protein